MKSALIPHDLAICEAENGFAERLTRVLPRLRPPLHRETREAEGVARVDPTHHVRQVLQP